MKTKFLRIVLIAALSAFAIIFNTGCPGPGVHTLSLKKDTTDSNPPKQSLFLKKDTTDTNPPKRMLIIPDSSSQNAGSKN